MREVPRKTASELAYYANREREVEAQRMYFARWVLKKALEIAGSPNDYQELVDWLREQAGVKEE